jgi:ubiquinone/menaquinone biosynthesis C-methylase UbiE
MARAFDELAPDYDHAHHDAVAAALIDFAGPPYEGAAADVACGSGAAALALARRRTRAGARRPGGAGILAVDLSPAMIDAGRARAAQAETDAADVAASHAADVADTHAAHVHAADVDAAGIDWRVGAALPLPVPDASLDLILCTSSLHFLGAAALRDWRRALRPGGRAAFSVPAATSFRPSGTFAGLLATDLTLPADAASARELALRAGFSDARATLTTVGSRQVALVVAG